MPSLTSCSESLPGLLMDMDCDLFMASMALISDSSSSVFSSSETVVVDRTVVVELGAVFLSANDCSGTLGPVDIHQLNSTYCLST
mmetsp:Transcript_13913/g.25473  ORF Transcript_13913/g.25473 Transcript_13913/m.25473 type:complete len:85 (-) Transcript_13913:1519-1773(-)